MLYPRAYTCRFVHWETCKQTSHNKLSEFNTTRLRVNRLLY